MAYASKQIYVNLPIKDLNKSVEFFSKIGFDFNPQFTDEKATCLIIGENMFAMLLLEDYFKSFTRKEIPDTAVTAELTIGISADSKEQVEALVHAALAAGGEQSGDPVDHGFMYQWGFRDLDGHIWEIIYMDMSAFPQA